MSGRTEFTVGEGIVISLDTVIQGGKEGVVMDLQDELDSTQRRITTLKEDLAELQERAEEVELQLARAVAKGEALRVAIPAAKKAFSL